ncbi:hypothetical protein D043_2938B, partial [Vibrio parahaemolyticus EKP-021]
LNNAKEKIPIRRSLSIPKRHWKRTLALSQLTCHTKVTSLNLPK